MSLADEVDRVVCKVMADKLLKKSPNMPVSPQGYFGMFAVYLRRHWPDVDFITAATWGLEEAKMAGGFEPDWLTASAAKEQADEYACQYGEH